MYRQLLMLGVLALGSVLAHPVSGARLSVPGGRYAQLDAATLHGQLASKDFTLINVHVPYEGEIAGTDRFVPFDRVAQDRRLPKDRAAEIVVYCRSGRMSEVAARALVKLGYTNVRELRGGMNAWAAAGYALRER